MKNFYQTLIEGHQTGIGGRIYVMKSKIEKRYDGEDFLQQWNQAKNAGIIKPLSFGGEYFRLDLKKALWLAEE